MEKQAILLFDLGSLQVFTMQDPIYFNLSTTFIDNYYWRDPASPQGYGPFRTLPATVEHYKWVLKACDGKKEEKIAPIIRVDFKTKKLVKTEI